MVRRRTIVLGSLAGLASASVLGQQAGAEPSPALKRLSQVEAHDYLSHTPRAQAAVNGWGKPVEISLIRPGDRHSYHVINHSTTRATSVLRDGDDSADITMMTHPASRSITYYTVEGVGLATVLATSDGHVEIERVPTGPGSEIVQPESWSSKVECFSVCMAFKCPTTVYSAV